jgi:alanyl-tRNA synthetase
MKTDELREKYLDFFKTKDHTEVASDVLVPKWDKSVLFTPAGMNQFKDHFLGKVKLDYTRATTSQKCLRTGDIENVGRTAYHHTFFEMLGNFSFGDYFKRDAINWAWEFLTDKKWLGINPDQLSVTVYLDDDEAAGFWQNDIGLPTSRIRRLDEHENFWPAGAPSNGPDGVCGPCSEIFYHPTPDVECEIWNLVFTQFNREGDPPNNLSPLPSKNIDTGMGLERTAATLQGVSTNFHIDTLMPIVEAAAEVCGVKYDAETENGRRLRRITDHVRACALSIHENVYPGSNREEYVVRRLLRRAVLQGHDMGLRDPFLFKLVPKVVEMLKRPYPDLVETTDRVEQVIKKEETSFLEKLDDGLARIEKVFASMKSANQTSVPGDEAAELYQTFGMPPELFESMAADRKLGFDWDGYQKAMDVHSEVSGKIADSVMGDFGPIDDIKREAKSTSFLGYESTEATAAVVGLIAGDQKVDSLETASAQPQYVVLDQTPFYAESGGQVGDTGYLNTANGKFEVTDTQKNGDVFVHHGKMIEGTLSATDQVTAAVDVDRRAGIQRAHSATHVLHHSLQQTLGSHAQQRGSKVTDDELRFDFSNLNPVTPEELATIERLTIEKIGQPAVVKAETLPLETARQQGAMMLFGEKYPDPVRMVSIGEFSKELCGGIHVGNTTDVAVFEIVAEESVSSGTRRIQALTGERARQNQQQVIDAAGSVSKSLGVSIAGLPSAVESLSQRVKVLKKQLSSGKSANNSPGNKDATDVSIDDSNYLDVRNVMRAVAGMLNVSVAGVAERVATLQSDIKTLEEKIDQQANVKTIEPDELLATGKSVDGVTVIVHQLEAGNVNVMKQLVDQCRKKSDAGPLAIFLATSESPEKVVLVAGLSKDLVGRGLSAGNWVKAVAPAVGGGGGGKPDLAQAGGKQPENIPTALQQAEDFISQQLAG